MPPTFSFSKLIQTKLKWSIRMHFYNANDCKAFVTNYKSSPSASYSLQPTSAQVLLNHRCNEKQNFSHLCKKENDHTFTRVIWKSKRQDFICFLQAPVGAVDACAPTPLHLHSFHSQMYPNPSFLYYLFSRKPQELWVRQQVDLCVS